VYSRAESGTEWQVERIPGGLAVLVTARESTPAELVVTGIVNNSYSASGGAAVEAMLRRHGVERLGRMVVLGGDYDALGDLMRVAGKCEVDSLLVRRRLEPSVSDLQARKDSSLFRGPVLYFGGTLERSSGQGCFLGDDRVTFRTSTSQVDIVDRVPAVASLSPTPGLTNVLIIGGRWQPEASEWIGFRRAGYDRIVCSDFEQPESLSWPDSELEPDALPPDYVVDLSKAGEIGLSIGR
jgi:hypothetical protein